METNEINLIDESSGKKKTRRRKKKNKTPVNIAERFPDRKILSRGKAWVEKKELVSNSPIIPTSTADEKLSDSEDDRYKPQIIIAPPEEDIVHVETSIQVPDQAKIEYLSDHSEPNEDTSTHETKFDYLDNFPDTIGTFVLEQIKVEYPQKEIEEDHVDPNQQCSDPSENQPPLVNVKTQTDANIDYPVHIPDILDDSIFGIEQNEEELATSHNMMDIDSMTLSASREVSDQTEDIEKEEIYSKPIDNIAESTENDGNMTKSIYDIEESAANSDIDVLNTAESSENDGNIIKSSDNDGQSTDDAHIEETLNIAESSKDGGNWSKSVDNIEEADNIPESLNNDRNNSKCIDEIEANTINASIGVVPNIAESSQKEEATIEDGIDTSSIKEISNTIESSQNNEESTGVSLENISNVADSSLKDEVSSESVDNIEESTYDAITPEKTDTMHTTEREDQNSTREHSSPDQVVDHQDDSEDVWTLEGVQTSAEIEEPDKSDPPSVQEAISRILGNRLSRMSPASEDSVTRESSVSSAGIQASGEDSADDGTLLTDPLEAWPESLDLTPRQLQQMTYLTDSEPENHGDTLIEEAQDHPQHPVLDRTPKKSVTNGRRLKHSQDLLQKWETLRTEADRRQKHTSELKQLENDIGDLRSQVVSLDEQCESIAVFKTEENAQMLQGKLDSAKALVVTLGRRREDLVSLNVGIHKYLSESPSDSNTLKEDLTELYRLWDATQNKANGEVSRIEDAQRTWRLWQEENERLQEVLKQDSHTLKVLDQAMQTGNLTDAMTSSAQDVAQLLNQRRQQNLNNNAHKNVTNGTSKGTTKPDDPYSDSGTSGYESCSSDDLSERERRLAHLKKLAKDLEATLLPGTKAWKEIMKTISDAENELQALQQKCRELFVKTAETLEEEHIAAIHPFNGSTRRRSWGKESKKAWKMERRGSVRGSRRNWAWRVVKAAIPFQAVFLLLLCVACLLEPNCCDSINTLNLNFNPQLRFLYGPPPV